MEKSEEEKKQERQEGKRQERVEKNRQINEEYRTWKENNPFLYDLIITHALEWPSLTVEWLPDRDEPSGKDYAIQKVILGTHTTENEPNYLMIAHVMLPLQDSESDALESDGSSSSGFASSNAKKVQIIQRIKHDGEVNRARYMPQDPFIIATRTIGGEVHIFDYRKHPANPVDGAACNPEVRLRGHTSEGYGLSWSKFKKGYLLSSADDSQICLWDLNATPTSKALSAMQIFKGHQSGVEDVAWHMNHEYLFGSAGDDRHLLLWDLRTPSVTNPSESVVAHQKAVNCLAFSPLNEWILATGSADKTVKLFDLRKFSNAIHTFEHHKKSVCQIGWSPKNETILASSCFGRRLLIWDLSRIGEEQTPADAEEGPPELLFIHGGHTDKVLDFSWNPCQDQDWTIASVAFDNIIQIWEMADHIYNEEE